MRVALDGGRASKIVLKARGTKNAERRFVEAQTLSHVKRVPGVAGVRQRSGRLKICGGNGQGRGMRRRGSKVLLCLFRRLLVRRFEGRADVVLRERSSMGYGMSQIRYIIYF